MLFQRLSQGVRDRVGVGHVLAVVLMLPAIVWAWMDRRVWPWDQAEYGYYAIWLWKYFLSGPLDWWEAMMLTLRLKTPGLPWLAQFVTPLGDLTGRYDSLFLMTVIATGTAALLLLVRIAQCLFPGHRLLHFLCPLMMAASPLFLGLNLQFLVEVPQMMAVCWLLLILTRMDKWPLPRVFWHTMAACVWGCLMKVTFLLYGILPLILIVIHMGIRIRKNPSEWRTAKFQVSDYAVMIFALFAGVMAMVWLGRNFEYLWAFVHANAHSTSGSVYGSAAPFWDKMRFWTRAIVDCYFVIPTFLASLALIVIYVMARWKMLRWVNPKDLNPDKFFRAPTCLNLWILSAVSFAFALAVHSAQANEVSRFLLPVLPYFVLIVAGILRFLNSRFLEICALVIFGYQYFYVTSLAFDLSPQGDSATSYLWTVERNPQRDAQLRETIQLTAAQPEAARRWIMAGCSTPTLSRNTLSYYMMKNRAVRAQDTQIFAYDFGESDLRKLLGQVKSKRPVYFISTPPDQIPPGLPEGLNLISPALLKAIAASPWYEKIPETPAPDILVYKIRGQSYLPGHGAEE